MFQKLLDLATKLFTMDQLNQLVELVFGWLFG